MQTNRPAEAKQCYDNAYKINPTKYEEIKDEIYASDTRVMEYHEPSRRSYL